VPSPLLGLHYATLGRLEMTAGETGLAAEAHARALALLEVRAPSAAMLPARRAAAVWLEEAAAAACGGGSNGTSGAAAPVATAAAVGRRAARTVGTQRCTVCTVVHSWCSHHMARCAVRQVTHGRSHPLVTGCAQSLREAQAEEAHRRAGAALREEEM